MDQSEKTAIQRIISRARAQKERPNWIVFWEECATYFYPERRGFIAQLPPGTELMELVWTSSPIADSERLADVIDEWSRPHGQYWIGLAPENRQLRELPEVRLWCQAVSYAMTEAIYNPASMFVQRSAEFSRDFITFGTAVMLIYYDAVGRHLVFKVPHLRDYVFFEGGRQQPADGYCFWEWTLQQLVDEMGIEGLPEELQRQWQDSGSRSLDQPYTIVHAVMPKLMAQKYGLDVSGILHPYVSLWICERYQCILVKDGFWENPYVVARWRTVTHEQYGRGPCMVALNDARTANAVAQSLVEITEKQGNPPVQYPFDMIKGEIELFPGGATPYDASGYQFQGDPIRPIQLGADAPLTDKYLQALEERIGRILYKDLWDTTAQHEETSEEAQARQMSAMTAAAPVFGKAQEQANTPILDRVFGIMMRLNAFGPPPPVLSGQRLRWIYDNTPIGQMRAAAEAAGIGRAIGTTLQIPVLQPAVQENLDGDLTVRRIWRSLGVPEILIKPMQLVIQQREQNAKLQQAQQMAEMAGKAAPAVKAGGDLAQSGALAKLLPPAQQPPEQA